MEDIVRKIMIFFRNFFIISNKGTAEKLIVKLTLKNPVKKLKIHQNCISL